MARGAQDDEVEKELQSDILSYSQNQTVLAKMNFEYIKELMTDETDETFKRPISTPQEMMVQYRSRTLDPRRPIIEEESGEDYENDEPPSQINHRGRHDDIHSGYQGEVRTISYAAERFKLLGRNSKGLPIYQMTDLYLATGRPVEKIFDERMSMYIHTERLRKVRESNTETLNQILDKWINKQHQDFYQGGKEELGLEELEEIVADMGEKKENFFLYYSGHEQPTKKYFEEVPVYYSVLEQETWATSYLRQIARNRQKYQSIEEFEETEATSTDLDWQKKEPRVNEFVLKDKQKPVYWGTLEDRNVKQLLPKNTKLYNITDDLRGNVGVNLTNLILKENSYVNSEIVNNAFLKPIEELQRLEIDLNNPHFYIDKIHSGIMRKEEEVYRLTDQPKQATVNQTVQDRVGERQPVPDGSMISSSKLTGPHTISIKPLPGEGVVGRAEPTNETIESLIANKLKSQMKTSLKHSDVANKLIFTKFKLDPREFQNFHRCTYPFERIRERFQVQLVKNKGIKAHAEYLQLNIEKQESYVKFPTPKSLSLSQGDYIAIENIEESPLLISNIGMCSKLSLQINSKAMLDAMQEESFDRADFQDLEKQREQQKPAMNKPHINESCANWRKIISDKLGPNGRIYIGDNDSLLIGTPQGIGVAVLESNLSNMAVVRQKNNPRDFILVRDGQGWLLRRIDSIYTSGVVEPKMEVFSPDSRQINNFLVNYLKSCVKKSFVAGQSVQIEELKRVFNNMNENAIRRHLKDVGARVDSDSRTFRSFEDRQVNYDVTPEEICQYEKMQNSLYNLQSIGIQYLRVPDKMKQIISTFFKKYPDNLRYYAISRMINDELHLTSWYLTESFINAQQGQAKMELEGIGDPTNGHGGYSFIKKPQKERMDKDEQLVEKKPDKKVSGTGADLRKLKTSAVTEMLLQRGIKMEDIKHMKRWARVDLLKRFGSGKYLRQERQTKKKKKEAQKKEISAIFNRMLRYLNNTERLEEVRLQDEEVNRIQFYIEREEKTWKIRREKFLKRQNQNEDIKEASEDEEEDEEEEPDHTDE